MKQSTKYTIVAYIASASTLISATASVYTAGIMFWIYAMGVSAAMLVYAVCMRDAAQAIEREEAEAERQALQDAMDAELAEMCRAEADIRSRRDAVFHYAEMEQK